MRRFILILITTIFLACTLSAFSDSCYPQIDGTKPQYIVGYGNFMNNHAVRQTDSNASANIPVELLGYQRTWGVVPARSPREMLVGIVQHPGYLINASVFRLSNSELMEKLDQREYGFCRKAVTRDELRQLAGAKLSSGQFWIYIPSNDLFRDPIKDAPISQGYVDVFLTGCIALERDYHLDGFAKQCIVTTSNWHAEWMQDHLIKRRAYITASDIQAVDMLLQQMLPSVYQTKPSQ